MEFNIYSIKHMEPESKDLQRARDLNFRSSLKTIGDTPLQGKADSMAKLITNEAKLIRRAKAIASYWGSDDLTGEVNGIEVTVNVFRPFAQKLESLGYGWTAIDSISKYKHEDVFEEYGIADLLGLD